MIGLAKLAAAVFGNGPIVNGLSCNPAASGLQIVISPGEIYQLAVIDSNQYGSLTPDTHQILKQGVALDNTSFTLTAPATAGQSIAYLVQATFQEIDGDLNVLPFYNATNPTQALMGQGNSGASLPTSRKGVCVLSVKQGPAAATGQQQPPAPDGTCSGLWVVTVSTGQTSITTANIAPYSAAPLLLETLPQKISQATGDARYASIAAAAAAQATANYAAPAGEVAFFAQSAVPTGWLAANGTLIPITSYQNLYNAIGIYYGSGTVVNAQGQTVSAFRLPDLRGEFIRGWDAARGVDVGRVFGTWQADMLGSHTHTTVYNGGLVTNYFLGYDGPIDASVIATIYDRGILPPTLNNTGGVETRPRNVALQACIKY